MMINTFKTLDLNFLGQSRAIAAYLIQHNSGVFLIECGPTSTIPGLLAALKKTQHSLSDVTDVLLTHIHLDHAGAAGWLARRGITIHVHPNGAPHLVNPDKLLRSARRIYGDQMDTLWGEFLAVPETQLNILQANEYITIGGIQIQALDTPGHAEHHYAYLWDETCFTGDIGGVRINGSHHVRLPMPPPEFHLEKWRQSLERLRQLHFKTLAPTHFGPYSDVNWHLDQIEENLDAINDWIEANLSPDLPTEDLQDAFLAWNASRAEIAGVRDSQLQVIEAVNPSWMSFHGIHRYWRKYRGQVNGNYV